MAYEFLVGVFPEGLEADHLCRNKKCVNPDHIEPVTKAENISRKHRIKTLRGCVRDHLWGDGDWYISSRGERICRPCRREKNAEKRVGMPNRRFGKRPPKLVCKQGHALEGENVYTSPRGQRSCYTCNRARQRAYKAARRSM